MRLVAIGTKPTFRMSAFSVAIGGRTDIVPKAEIGR